MDIGHSSNEPCVVCGRHNNNQIEPRFLYTVCEEHKNVPPTKLQLFKFEDLKGNDR